MNKEDVKTFFDRLAPTWDENLEDRTPIIEKILDEAQIGEGHSILDVGCGTGVMFPYYLKRGAARIVGVDLSEGMTDIAKEKFAKEPKVTVLCADVEELTFEEAFDQVMIYNAFPHFVNPARVIAYLAALLTQGGRLTIAHGMSREKINNHHKGEAAQVSLGLMEAEDLKALFEPFFDVDVVIHNDLMYEVSGIKR